MSVPRSRHGPRVPGRPEERETFYAFSSFNTPPTIYRYDMTSGESQLWRAAEVDFDPERFQVEQVFYPQPGWHPRPHVPRVPRGLTLDGRQPGAALWLRRIQHPNHALVQCRLRGLDGDGWRSCRCQSARWRRIWRGVASGRQDAEQAECV